MTNTRCIDVYGNEHKAGHFYVNGHTGCARCGAPVRREIADALNAETDQWGNSTVPDGGWDEFIRSMKV